MVVCFRRSLELAAFVTSQRLGLNNAQHITQKKNEGYDVA